MPKMKSNRAAKKRFKLTGSGKVKRSKAYKRHKLLNKTKKQKRALRSSGLLTGGDAKKVLKSISA
ncbi:MAG: 50S ribosomal protein L35 [Candidatus Marinimicrobia bacterium]|nr:50S ribosomal protein L35 [Candidatus Neomarinimicrobiota bacterium]MCF7840370.1 50S ribosomal protein L35 [Candidatus Neomarinimicrobiota bacterium]